MITDTHQIAVTVNGVTGGFVLDTGASYVALTARFAAKDEIPVDLLEQWVDESYRTIAPKKVLAKLEAADAKKR